LQSFLGPGHEELVGARNALRSGEASPRIGDDRPPAKPFRGATKLLGEIDSAEDEQPRRRAEHLGEDLLAVALEQMRACDLSVLGDPALAGAVTVDDGEDDLRR